MVWLRLLEHQPKRDSGCSFKGSSLAREKYGALTLSLFYLQIKTDNATLLYLIVLQLLLHQRNGEAIKLKEGNYVFLQILKIIEG